MLSIRFLTSETDPSDLDTPIDYGPARRACAALVAWAADVARSGAPDDAEAITRAEIAVRGQLAGRRCAHHRLDYEDAIITSAALIDALAVDLGIPLAPQLGGALGAIFANAGDRSRGGETPGSPVTRADVIAALLASLRTPGPVVVHLGDRARNENER